MLIKYLKEIAPTPVFEHHPPVSSQNNPSILEQLTCRVCLKILQQPLELLCSALACAQCLVERVATSTTLQCPCCSSDAHLVPSLIRPAPDLILVLLNDILVLCVKCNREMKAHSYEGHECTSCLTASEERTAAGILKRAVSTSPKGIATVKKGFSEKEGPFVKQLDSALQLIGVQRQQYFGGAFVGNHVHKALKVHILCFMQTINHENIFQLPNVKTLCTAISQMAQEKLPHRSGEVAENMKNFINLFSLFGKCHNISDQNVVKQLQCIVKEHLLSIEPRMVAAIPPPTKKQKT